MTTFHRLGHSSIKTRLVSIIVLVCYLAVGIPAATANWYQELQQANSTNSIPYQVWVPGTTPQLQLGSESPEACFESVNELAEQQASVGMKNRQSALAHGLSCVEQTAAQVQQGKFPQIASGISNELLFIDGFIHGFRDGFEQSANGLWNFVYGLFTNPGNLYDAAKELINHPSILYKLLQKLPGDAAQTFAKIVCSPAYESGKEAGKLVGDVAIMLIPVVDVGGAVAKSVASYAAELARLGISETGAVGYRDCHRCAT